MKTIQVTAITTSELLELWSAVFDQPLRLSFTEFNVVHKPSPFLGDMALASGVPTSLAWYDALNILSLKLCGVVKQRPTMLIPA